MDEKTLVDIHGKVIGTKLAAMARMNACLSFKHLSKFSSVKDKVMAWVRSHPEETHLISRKFHPSAQFYAFNLNDDYSYLHVFKSGGTTVQMMTTTKKHTKSSEVDNRKLVTVVRDPIDHFLSGWAECGSRSKNPDENPHFTLDTGINERIGSWLDSLEDQIASPKQGADPCLPHSFPQSSFMLNPNKLDSISPNLEMIGDLRELNAVLTIANFTIPPNSARARSASDNPKKVERYPRDMRLLSDQTVNRICEFVMLDYLLFDFEPPSACSESLQF